MLKTHISYKNKEHDIIIRSLSTSRGERNLTCSSFHKLAEKSYKTKLTGMYFKFSVLVDNLRL